MINDNENDAENRYDINRPPNLEIDRNTLNVKWVSVLWWLYVLSKT